MNGLAVVILAAGKGTRMRSEVPKVLHSLAGQSLLSRVIIAARTLQPDSLHVVCGHQSEVVRESLSGQDINWVLQHAQKGTGHAVTQVMPDLSEDKILILYGDVPLIQSETLKHLIALADQNTLALLTQKLEEPTGYGRIVRNESGQVTAIVEHKDATEAQLQINEINTGIMVVSRALLEQALPTLSCNNSQGEYYLTDIIALAVSQRMTVATSTPTHHWETLGINDRKQLAALERFWQQHQAESLMEKGVTLADPARLDIRGNLESATDVFIDVNVVIEGEVKLGRNVVVGPGVIIRNSSIACDVRIEAYSIIENAQVGQGCVVGPFARLRPGTRLDNQVRVGNFVELKNTTMAAGSKANHLSYLGDANIGCDANIGAGTITCNYDGVNKWQTVIGDKAFIGSNTSLVAPLCIGNGATVGAGSTVTRNVEDQQLAVARNRQRNLDGWKRPAKKDEGQ